MKLGITMPSRTAELRRIPQYAQWAEQAGLDTVWSWELVKDPISQLATSSMVTERIGLGTGLAVASNRAPAAMAHHALDIDEMSGGRMHLGLGPGEAADVPARVHGRPSPELAVHRHRRGTRLRR